MTILMSVRRHLLVRTRAVCKPLTCLTSRWAGLYMLRLYCWRVLSNKLPGVGVLKLSSVIVIFDGKFILDLGMVWIQRDFRILGCLWDVFIISILNYVLK